MKKRLWLFILISLTGCSQKQVFTNPYTSYEPGSVLYRHLGETDRISCKAEIANTQYQHIDNSKEIQAASAALDAAQRASEPTYNHVVIGPNGGVYTSTDTSNDYYGMIDNASNSGAAQGALTRAVQRQNDYDQQTNDAINATFLNCMNKKGWSLVSSQEEALQLRMAVSAQNKEPSDKNIE